MTEGINRRKFLKNSALGISALVFASSLQAINVASSCLLKKTSGSLTISEKNLMDLYKQAMDYFYKKRYSDAGLLLNQLIIKHPNVLYLYDGLARVYGAQQNLYNVATLYLKGVNSNPQNAFFYHRYGLSLRTLCLGNAVQAQRFANKHNISNLYESAAEQVLTAVSLNPKECFKLDLKDFPRLLKRYNENPRNLQMQLFLSATVISQIEYSTASVSEKWTTSRTSGKPAILLADKNFANRKIKQNLHSG